MLFKSYIKVLSVMLKERGYAAALEVACIKSLKVISLKSHDYAAWLRLGGQIIMCRCITTYDYELGFLLTHYPENDPKMSLYS